MNNKSLLIGIVIGVIAHYGYTAAMASRQATPRA